MATMKAIRQYKYGGPRELKYETNVPRPMPGPFEVLVHVKAAGVNNCDVIASVGGFRAYGEAEFPFIPGSDFAGVVEEVGTEVTTFKKNDRVYGCGTVGPDGHTYAEYLTIKHSYVQLLPDALSFSEGAGLAVPYYTAYCMLQYIAKAKSGETLLVHGASGGTGIATVQIAKAMGLTVIGTAGTSEGAELVTTAGANSVFNHRERSYIKQIKQAAGEKGVDIVIESVYNKNLGKDIELVGMGGRIVVIGGKGNVEINPGGLMGKLASITGMSIFRMAEEHLEEMGKAIQDGITAGWLRPHIWKEFPLQKASDAYRLITGGSGARGKIVLLTEEQQE